MKKYKFLFISAFLVFLGILVESLKKKPKEEFGCCNYIVLEPKVRFSPNGTMLYVLLRRDTMIISTRTPFIENEDSKKWLWDSLLLAKFVK